MMQRQVSKRRAGLTLGWLLAGTLVAGVALAQGPPDGPPPPFGGPGGPPPPFGGPGGGPPPFGRPGGGPPPPATAASAPLALLDAKLKLTASQNTQITQIQSDLRQKRDALRPQRGPQPQGPPPDRGTMQANREKLRAMDTEASDKISAVLTAAQRQSLTGVLAEIDALRADGIPPEVYGDLKLSADQEKQLTAIGTASAQARKQAMDKARASGDFPAPPEAMRQARQQTDAKVSALLTAAQRQTLDTFRQDHPRPGFGGPGFGDPGGPGGPGFGGPPPPDGNGPPPPGD